MSTLTKVLIVLLTVFAIFLCGIVVTYVANAENHREKADRLQRDILAAKRSQEAALRDLEDEKKAATAYKQQLDDRLTALDIKVKELLAELDNTKRQNDQLLQEVQQQRASASLANELASKQTEMFETARQQVQALQADQSNRKKELDETNQMLTERLAIIAELESKNRRLIEENQDLQTRGNQYLQQYGRMATRPQTVTPRPPSPVQPMPTGQPGATQTRPIGLNGRVTAVDMKNRLAEISIGGSAGVRQDMKFYVTRGERFVANILILDVSPDKAVGILELVQAEPLVGDTVTTNL